MNTLTQSLRDLKNAGKIVTFDPISRKTWGYHNNAIDYISRKIEIRKNHHHVLSSRRQQRNERKNKNKSAINFPIIDERFETETKLIQCERDAMISAAIAIINNDVNDDGSITIAAGFFKQKF